MAKRKSVNKKTPVKKTPVKKTPATSHYIERIETEVQSNQSKVSMVLGALIILVVGILIFNYFNKNKPILGPAQETQNTQEDVSTDSLPGKYTVKEGDTLFTIAQKYYQDGFKYTEIVKTNNLTNADLIEAGQVLQIPKIETQTALATLQPSPSTEDQQNLGTGTGGGNSTIWGTKIEGDKYTVTAGDWLSTIAGRAYGDILAFDKIAKANNIQNPNVIEPGTVLTIPR